SYAPAIYTLSLHDALPIFDSRTFAVRCNRSSRTKRNVFKEPRADAEVIASRFLDFARKESVNLPDARPSRLHSPRASPFRTPSRSEEHTSELPSLRHLVCR